ncbi:nucleoside triphosphate pyrophosphohydrolase family protein [Roseiflexus castenholzii]|jgi:Holliday junction resolvasome RuvABC DNA-binding subunit|uniref:hypothetical protein n=1 Tax=Roseiflexus castenholzii TaxID=120962 RepID=UPI00031562FB|nr:hypothetical protein [Roseiflexus castenholzii]
MKRVKSQAEDIPQPPEIITPEDQEALKYEPGDGRRRLAQICTELKLTLAEVAEANQEKRRSRQERGQIGGDGDHR